MSVRGGVKYRVSQEECAILRESVPYVKLYRYNPKHLYPKLNGYGDKGLIISTPHQTEKNEMGGACSMHGGGERCIQGFGGET